MTTLNFAEQSPGLWPPAFAINLFLLLVLKSFSGWSTWQKQCSKGETWKHILISSKQMKHVRPGCVRTPSVWAWTQKP